jgi:hypothetical protein
LARNLDDFYETLILKKFGPFSALFMINLAKIRPLIFPAPPKFFSVPFVFCGRNFGLLATLCIMLTDLQAFTQARFAFQNAKVALKRFEV